MKVGILMPIAETDSGTILRYRTSATRHQWSAIGLIRSGSSTTSSSSGTVSDEESGRAGHCLRPWPRPRLASSWECAGHVHGVRNPALLAKMADAVDEESAGR